MDILKRIHNIMGFIPMFWLTLFVIFMPFPSNQLIWKITFIMFFVSFYTSLIYLFLTLILVFWGKKNIIKSVRTLVSLFVIILIFIIIMNNPGGYFYILLD
jgi:hypothetical protein